jgi:hypothetical protein
MPFIPGKQDLFGFLFHDHHFYRGGPHINTQAQSFGGLIQIYS